MLSGKTYLTLQRGTTMRALTKNLVYAAAIVGAAAFATPSLAGHHGGGGGNFGGGGGGAAHAGAHVSGGHIGHAGAHMNGHMGRGIHGLGRGAFPHHGFRGHPMGSIHRMHTFHHNGFRFHGHWNHWSPAHQWWWRHGHWWHGWHGAHFGWWWAVGPWWYWYDGPVYPYPGYASATVYGDDNAYGGDDDGMWYYCRNPEGYYPYVKHCNGEWQQVPAQPEGAYNDRDDNGDADDDNDSDDEDDDSGPGGY